MGGLLIMTWEFPDVSGFSVKVGVEPWERCWGCVGGVSRIEGLLDSGFLI